MCWLSGNSRSPQTAFQQVCGARETTRRTTARVVRALPGRFWKYTSEKAIFLSEQLLAPSSFLTAHQKLRENIARTWSATVAWRNTWVWSRIIRCLEPNCRTPMTADAVTWCMTLPRTPHVAREFSWPINAQLISLNRATVWTVRGSNPGAVRERSSAPVQSGPGAHPSSYTMGTGSHSREYSGRGVALTTHPITCRG